jgi:hypothetical protein
MAGTPSPLAKRQDVPDDLCRHELRKPDEKGITTMFTVYLSNSVSEYSPQYKARTFIGAKRLASKVFGDGFRDHQINIVDDSHGHRVAWRNVGDRKWRDYSDE